MLKIYIAGPYSGPDIITILENIRRGIEAGHYLISKGFAVFCPFLDYQFAFFNNPANTLTKEQYQANSIEWVKICDAVFCLPGWEKSGGVSRELQVALENNIPTFERYEYLFKWARNLPTEAVLTKGTL
jgi:hypothetical protein